MINGLQPLFQSIDFINYFVIITSQTKILKNRNMKKNAQTNEFTLRFDPIQKNFSTKFKGSRKFLHYLKDAELLPYSLPDLFPKTFNGEIIIDKIDQGEESYSIDFYLDVEATNKMKETMTRYKNRDIEIDEENNKLEFSLKIERQSGYIIKDNKEEIVLSF